MTLLPAVSLEFAVPLSGRASAPRARPPACPVARPPFPEPGGGSTALETAVVREFRQPLICEDGPVPEPGDGQVLVKIEASGRCHTDLHAILTGEGPLYIDAGPRLSSPPIRREPAWT